MLGREGLQVGRDDPGLNHRIMINRVKVENTIHFLE